MRGPWEAAAIFQAINVQHNKRQSKYQTDQNIIIIKISTQENKAHLKELEGNALTLLVPREATNCWRPSSPGRQKALKSEYTWPCHCAQRPCHLLNHQELRILLKGQTPCKWNCVETGCCSLYCSPAAPRTGNYLLTKVTTFSRAASCQHHCPHLLADKCVQKIAAGKSVRPIAQATIPSIQG